jgi:hypothetical protein
MRAPAGQRYYQKDPVVEVGMKKSEAIVVIQKEINSWRMAIKIDPPMWFNKKFERQRFIDGLVYARDLIKKIPRSDR